MHHTLSESDLDTSDGKKLLRYINEELLKRDHRIATFNKAKAQTYLKSLEQQRQDNLGA